MATRLQTPRAMTILDPVSGEITSRGMLILIGLCFALTLICVWLVDRSVATYAHHNLRVGGKEHWFFKALTDIPDSIPVIAGLVAAWYAGGLLFGVRPGPRGRVALQAALAVLVAITLKEQLKVLAGRTWPETWTNNNPSWIKDGVYGFFPLQALLVEKTGRAYFAFPSGHMTIIAVAMASLALNAPRFTWFAPIPVVLVAIGMVGANYHWVSDLIFGSFLGAGVALAAYRLDRGAG
ncbi:MAG: phosphatase PAP2 family protein [Hyphomicrobiaceae bacterium]|nr:phosphatase PAP2 family protein [Hyphomicrobiaceae bacterium]